MNGRTHLEHKIDEAVLGSCAGRIGSSCKVDMTIDLRHTAQFVNREIKKKLGRGMFRMLTLLKSGFKRAKKKGHMPSSSCLALTNLGVVDGKSCDMQNVLHVLAGMNGFHPFIPAKTCKTFCMYLPFQV